MSDRRRYAAQERWRLCQLGLGWLRISDTTKIGWDYWMASEQWSELLRRRFIDKYSRITDAGRRAMLSAAEEKKT